MTLNEILVAALDRLERGHDAKTLAVWRQKLTAFANDAVTDILSTFHPCKTESVRINGSTIDTAAFERPCVQVVSVLQDGVPLRFSVADASGIISVRGKGLVSVVYRHMPASLVNPFDVPDIPSYLHPLIVTYIVCMERVTGDKRSADCGETQMSFYESEKRKLLSALGTPHSFINRW